MSERLSTIELQQAMMPAIQANDAPAVAALVQQLAPNSFYGDWIHESIRLDQRRIVSILQPHYNAIHQEMAAGWAYQCHHDALAEQIRREHHPVLSTLIDSQPFDLFQALTWAAGKGWDRAVDQWLAQGAMDHRNVSGLNPLADAASHGHLALTQRLLPLFDNDDKNMALHLAAKDNQQAVVAWLWPHCDREGHDDAVNAAVIHGHEALLTFMLDQYPPEVSRSAKLNYAMCEAIRKSLPMSSLQALARLTDLNTKKAEPLREAVNANRPDLITWLLPQSDADLARKHWTAQQPPQWDMVLRVFPYLPSEKQKDWVKIYQRKRPEILACWREIQAQAEVPKTEPRRRRFRS